MSAHIKTLPRKWKVQSSKWLSKAESAKGRKNIEEIRVPTRGIHVARTRAMPPWDLIERTRLFALAVLKFCRRLPSTPEAQEAARQLRRAATSARSNYRAARKSRSRAEFRSKLHIAFEEADECVDWLEYLKDGKIQEDSALLQEGREIASILATAVRTARKNATNG